MYVNFCVTGNCDIDNNVTEGYENEGFRCRIRRVTRFCYELNSRWVLETVKFVIFYFKSQLSQTERVNVLLIFSYSYINCYWLQVYVKQHTFSKKTNERYIIKKFFIN